MCHVYKEYRYREIHGSSHLYCMKTAFAIGCWLPKRWHERMALACIRSIRLTGHTQDIYVLTIDPDLKNRIGERDWKVLCFDEINYEAIWTENSPRDGSPALRISDAQKLYFWLVGDYDKVLAIDCDVIIKKDCSNLWKSPDLSIAFAKDSPIISGQFVYQPNKKVFDDLKQLLVSNSFSIDTGWNNCGRCNAKYDKWNFQAASTSQGYLYYYFGILHKRLHSCYFVKYLTHFEGKKHRSKPELYKTQIQSMIAHQ